MGQCYPIWRYEKFVALRKHHDNYDAKIKIPDYLDSDFKWWLKNLPNASSQIIKDNFSLEIFSDASTTGWGRSCNNTQTGGFWNNSQTQMHINSLELIAAYYALKSFTNNMENCNILLRITTAISCINRMGSVQYTKLNDLTRKIWQWCKKKDTHKDLLLSPFRERHPLHHSLTLAASKLSGMLM